jgi:hypothetical protein
VKRSLPVALGERDARRGAERPRIGPARPTLASAAASRPSDLALITAPRNGMNIGALAWMPSRRSWRTCPISWMKSSTTKPTANLQPQISEYAAMLTSIDPDVVRTLSLGSASSATLPNFSAKAPATSSGPSRRPQPRRGLRA